MNRVSVQNKINVDNLREVKSCGAIIYIGTRLRGILSNFQFLLIKHRADHGNHWDFPKGLMEKDESEKDTVLREVYEESGLEINLTNGFREEIHYIIPFAKVYKVTVYYLSHIESGDIHLDPKEIAEYKWLPYSEAIKLLTNENAKEVLMKANEFILKN